MALPSNGPISMSMIRTELELGSMNNLRLNGSEMCQYTDLNNLSISNSFEGTTNDVPNIQTPNAISEWYGYNHKYSKDLADTLFFNDIIAPYGYPCGTFTTIDLGVINEETYVDFTGSNFSNTGTAPNAAVSYSLYYSTYSIDLPNSKLLKTGVLKSSEDRESFIYQPNADSGSKITWIWTSGSAPAAPPDPIVYWDSYYNDYTNRGFGADTYDGDDLNSTIVNANENFSYYSCNNTTKITSSGDFSIGLSGSITVHVMFQWNETSSGFFQSNTAGIWQVCSRYDTTQTPNEWVSNGANVYMNMNSPTYNFPETAFLWWGGEAGSTGDGVYFNKNTWYSIIYRYDNKTKQVSYFINNSFSDGGGRGHFKEFSGRIRIGPNNIFTGTLDYRIGFLRIWKKALSDGQINNEFENFRNRYNL